MIQLDRKELLDLYINYYKWDLVPIKMGTKFPFMKDWNNKSYTNNLVFSNNYNIGLLLGKIIDVEADSEEANNYLDRLTIGVKHPIYKSKKSKHHLFLCHDPKLTRFVDRNIEFRGKKHQSILPPSIVYGIEYSWIEFGMKIPEIPKSLLKFYWKTLNNKRRKLGKIT